METYACSISGIFKEIFQGMHGNIVIRYASDIIRNKNAQILKNLIIIGILSYNSICNQHTVICNCSCLVDTNCIDPGKSFYTSHVMKHYLIFCKPYGT